jgi:hypothetical protein
MFVNKWQKLPLAAILSVITLASAAMACGDGLSYSLAELKKMPEATIQYPGAEYDAGREHTATALSGYTAVTFLFGTNDPPSSVGKWFAQTLHEHGWSDHPTNVEPGTWSKEGLIYSVECNSNNVGPGGIATSSPLRTYRTVCQTNFQSTAKK